MQEKSMPKRRRETHRKTHRKNIKNRCQNGAKIDEKSMENRRRKGRRRRDENRTLEVRSSIEMSNLLFFKIHEILLVFVLYFEVWPFRFERPARTQTFNKRFQKS